MIRANNDGNMMGVAQGNNGLKNAYATYLKTTTICDFDNTPGTCWHNASTDWQLLNGDPSEAWMNPGAGVITSDGIFMKFRGLASDCSDTSGGRPACGQIMVDINGFNEPNVMGKDVFMIGVEENRITPAGMPDSPSPDNCRAGTKGESCAWEIMNNTYDWEN